MLQLGFDSSAETLASMPTLPQIYIMHVTKGHNYRRFILLIRACGQDTSSIP